MFRLTARSHSSGGERVEVGFDVCFQGANLAILTSQNGWKRPPRPSVTTHNTTFSDLVALPNFARSFM